LYLFRRIYLCVVEGSLEVVELVGVSFLTENGRPVVIGEGFGDRLRVVLKVENEDIMLLRVGAVQAAWR
jgi:hypothetical protein